MQEIADVLLGVLAAREKILLKMNVDGNNLTNLVNELPTMKRPTISPLYSEDGEKGMFAVETIIEKSDINEILPRIRRAGARDILEMGLKKIIP
jgi:ATP phosphoribosyltransferase